MKNDILSISKDMNDKQKKMYENILETTSKFGSQLVGFDYDVSETKKNLKIINQNFETFFKK